MNPLLTLEFLFTETIVSALSIWIGFAWAMVFLSGTSVMLVFQQYGWNQGQLGMMQLYVSNASGGTGGRRVLLISVQSLSEAQRGTS